MTKTTETPSHDNSRLASMIRDFVPQIANSEYIQGRINGICMDSKGNNVKQLEELEQRTLRHILNATEARNQR